MNYAKRKNNTLKVLAEGIVKLVAAGNGSGNDPIPRNASILNVDKTAKVRGGNGSGNNPIGTKAMRVYPVIANLTEKP